MASFSGVLRKAVSGVGGIPVTASSRAPEFCTYSNTSFDGRKEEERKDGGRNGVEGNFC